MTIAMMCGAGLQFNASSLRDVLKDYGLLGKAILANFILLPALAFFTVQMFSVNNEVATGILLMAMAPGTPFLVNSAGRKQGGSLEFALMLAFIFSVLSVATIPITAHFILPSGALDELPPLGFLTTLVAYQAVPLAIGAILGGRLSAAVKQRLSKALGIVFLGSFVVFFALAMPKFAASVSAVFGMWQLTIVAAIALFAFGMGWLFGGPKPEHRRTLSLVTLTRNVGLCGLIASEAFPGTLTVPTVIAYSIVTIVVSIPIQQYYKRSAAPTPS